MAMGGTVASLFKAAGLIPLGPVRWGERVPSHRPGVYVVQAPSESWSAPFSMPAIEAWIERVPGIRVDGAVTDAKALRNRLDQFWITSEPVLYIGRAGTDVDARVRAYHKTPLGDPRPHAGGHWLKTLSILDRLLVWWAETDDPVDAEARLMWAFADRHGVGFLPFANRQDATGDRKDHGITRSTLSRRSAQTGVGDQGQAAGTRSATGRDSNRLAAINSAVQRFAGADPRGEVTAVEAAAELDRLGLLRDSAARPGLPLRKLLRQGSIEHARQDGGRWWVESDPDRAPPAHRHGPVDD
jgi:hypothetical protein